MGELEHIHPTKLRRCPYSLRPVRKESLEYIQFREYVQRRGEITVPLLVRQGAQVVDGNYRLEIALDLNLVSVPCFVSSMSDFEVLVEQVQLNLNATNGQYAARLWRIMEMKPELTLDGLAHLVTKSRDWLSVVLRLGRLVNKDSLYKGTVPILVGAELAKLPPDYQRQLNLLAYELTTADLVDMIKVSVRKYREALKDNRASRNLQNQVELTPRYRTFREVVNELKEPSAAVSVLHRSKATTALDGWLAAHEWILSVDAGSLDQRQRKLESLQRKADRHRERTKPIHEPLD